MTVEEQTCPSSAAVSIYGFYLSYFLAAPTLLWLISYIIPQVFMAIRKVPDLKKKYDAKWVSWIHHKLGQD